MIVFVELALFTPEERSAFTGIFRRIEASGEKVLQIHYSREAVLEEFAYLILPHYFSQFKGQMCGAAKVPWFSLEDYEWLHRFEASIAQRGNFLFKRAPTRVLAQAVHSVFEDLQPSLVVTHNVIGHLCVLFRKASSAFGIPCIMTERAPFHGYYLIDNESMWHRSKICESIGDPGVSADSSCQAAQAEVAALADKPSAFRKSDRISLESTLAGECKVLFLPEAIDLSGWGLGYAEAIRRDYGEIVPPSVVIESLSTAVTRLKGSLIIKPHPICKFFNLIDTPNVTVLDRRVRLEDILPEVDLVVCLNSKTAFAAAAAGLPVLSLVRNPITVSGVAHFSTLQDLETTIRKLVEDGDASVRSRLRGFSGWLFRHYYFNLFSSNETPLDRDHYTDTILAARQRQRPVEAALEAVGLLQESLNQSWELGSECRQPIAGLAYVLHKIDVKTKKSIRLLNRLRASCSRIGGR